LATLEDLKSNEYVIAVILMEAYLESETGHVRSMVSAGHATQGLNPLSSGTEVNGCGQWIEQGAKWRVMSLSKKHPKPIPPWWALQPLSVGTSSSLPSKNASKNASQAESLRHDADRRIHHCKTELRNGTQTGPQADRRTLTAAFVRSCCGFTTTPEEGSRRCH